MELVRLAFASLARQEPTYEVGNSKCRRIMPIKHHAFPRTCNADPRSILKTERKSVVAPKQSIVHDQEHAARYPGDNLLTSGKPEVTPNMDRTGPAKRDIVNLESTVPHDDKPTYLDSGKILANVRGCNKA